MLTWACGQESTVDEGSPVATYRDKQLSSNEVVFHLPDSLEINDSLRLSQLYIQDWIKSQAVTEAAYQAIPDLESRILYRLRDYERSLIEHEYAQHLLDRNGADLVVSEEEIREYYESNHPEKFQSRGNYYQYFYLKTPLSGQYKVVNLLRSNEEEKLEELKAWAEENASEYKLDSIYVTETEIERISDGYYYGNIKRASEGVAYAYAHREGPDQEMVYDFFKLISVIEEGETLPLSMCRQRIQQIIRNQRKQKLLERHFNELAKQAEAGGKTRVIQ